MHVGIEGVESQREILLSERAGVSTVYEAGSSRRGSSMASEVKDEVFRNWDFRTETEYLTFSKATHTEPCLVGVLEVAMAPPETRKGSYLGARGPK